MVFALSAQNVAVPGSAEIRVLPRGFASIYLGFTFDEVYGLLQKEPLFSFRGRPDVSIPPFGKERKEQLIQSDGSTYLESGIFQFHEDALYSITLRMDSSQMDYYTMYATLSKRYGDPDSLDPRSARWESDGVRMELERPVVVRYIDMGAFNAIRESGAQQESLRQYSRELFLDNF